MTKETYEMLSVKEKLIYDELCVFSRKLTDQMAALTAVMQKLLDVATLDP